MSANKEMFDSFQGDYRLLIEAGFVAVQQLDEKSGRKLFNAAKVLRPEDVVPDIGLGYIHLNKLERKPALDIFSDVIARDPEHDLAKVLYGVTLMLASETRDNGKKVVKDVMNKTKDPTVKNFGKVSLEWCAKDLKDSKAPFFSKKETEK